MSREQTVGIVGGYGGVGVVVARELARSGGCDLLIGGRSLEKAEELARSCGPRAAAAVVDLYDRASLLDFCRRCGVVVNCASPTFRVMDKVAQAAIECGSHYVDPAGGHAIEGMAAMNDKIRQQQLRCVVSAGWVPGILELFTRQVASPLETVDEVGIYVQDRTEWSQASSEDIIHFILQLPYGEYRHGRWADVPVSLGSRETYHFPTPFAVNKVLPRQCREIEQFSQETGARKVAVYYPADFKVIAFEWVMKRLFHDREEKAAGIMRAVMRMETRMKGTAGMICVEARGTIAGRPERCSGTISYSGERAYFVSGLPTAIATRWILDGRIKTDGVVYLANAVPSPADFMQEVSAAGLPFEIRGPAGARA